MKGDEKQSAAGDVLAGFRRELLWLRDESKLLRGSRHTLEKTRRRLDGLAKAGVCLAGEERVWLERWNNLEMREREFQEKSERLERRMDRVFRSAAAKLAGRDEVERVVFASVIFWDWYGAQPVPEPDWLTEMRTFGNDGLLDVDDTAVGVGLVMAGYSPAEAAARLFSNSSMEHIREEVLEEKATEMLGKPYGKMRKAERKELTKRLRKELAAEFAARIGLAAAAG